MARGDLAARIWLPERTDPAARVQTFDPVATQEQGTSGQASRMARDLALFFTPLGTPSDWIRRVRMPEATPFRRAILETCMRIQRGHAMSYSELAEAAGYPGCARAAGTVMATNPLPLAIPCHRVVRSDRSPGQYGGGTAMKRWLLEIEGVPFYG